MSKFKVGDRVRRLPKFRNSALVIWCGPNEQVYRTGAGRCGWEF